MRTRSRCSNAGAHFTQARKPLYAVIMNALEPGEDPTTADLTMMADIDAELRDFVRAVAAGRM